MKRQVVQILSVASFLAAMAASIGWWRSYRVGDEFTRVRRIDGSPVATSLQFTHGGGLLWVSFNSHTFDDSQVADAVQTGWLYRTHLPAALPWIVNDDDVYRFAGVGWRVVGPWRLPGKIGTSRTFMVHYWLIVGISMILPLRFAWIAIRRHRQVKVALTP